MKTAAAQIQDIFKNGAAALAESFQPDKSALITIDAQNFYCNPLFPAAPRYSIRQTLKIAAALARMNELAAFLRPLLPICWVAHDIPVTEYIRDRESFEKMEPAAQLTWLQTVQREAQAICAASQPDDMFCRKRGFDCYDSAELTSALHARHMDTHLIAGLMREDCVRASAYHGAALGFHVVVVEDATVICSDYDEDKLLAMYLDANAHGVHCVQSHQVKDIIGAHPS